MFKGKGCSWLPENRVLDEIHQGTVLVSDQVKCEFECNGITDEDLYELFAEHRGSVNFGDSEPREDPKMYIIEADDADYSLKIYLKDSVARIASFILDGKKSCNCAGLSDSTYRVFSKPVSKIRDELFYTENKEVKFNKKAKCEMNCYNISSEQISEFIDSEPNWNKTLSRLDESPAIYVFEGKINGKNYQLYFEDAGRRTRLVEILSGTASCDCH